MLSVDYSKKVLHVAMNLATTKEAGCKGMVHEGLIYYPSMVFSKINERAEDHFADFFKVGRQFKVTCLKTEMGPGELAKKLQKRFSAECSIWIGGMIAPFTIPTGEFEKFWELIESHPDRLLKSTEKKVFGGRRQIRGLAVRV